MSQETTVQTVWCTQCGQARTQSDLVLIAGNWVCANCKPVFLSRIMASGAPGASLIARHYGGFWIRFGARMIDGLVFIIPAALLFVALLLPNMRTRGSAANPFEGMFAPFAFLAFFVIFFLAGACYEILMLKYRSGTLGKMACGLKVIRSDGRDLSWGVCFGRFFMWNVVTSGIPYLNYILMLISGIMAGVDDQKRALHDRVCDTRVIYKQSAA